jgi:hypothetical protein
MPFMFEWPSDLPISFSLGMATMGMTCTFKRQCSLGSAYYQLAHIVYLS